MEYEITISKTRSYIAIIFYSPMTTDVAFCSGPELVRLAIESNINRFLFDLRQAPNVQSTADNYFFANRDIEDFSFPRASMSAFLVREDDTSHEFITLAFLNAGYIVKLFTEEAAAVAWLENGGRC